MTKVKSISIEGSEPTPIVDKGIDEAQSRNTVANTDVVKVQDGNGVWHAIPFNKFIEVATPLVASIMNNLNLQGNIVKFLGLNANGAPGVSSLADAAAALGAFLYLGSMGSDNVTKQSITLDNSGSSLPNDALVLNIYGSLNVQLAFVRDANFLISSVKVRMKQNSQTWSGKAWKTISIT